VVRAADPGPPEITERKEWRVDACLRNDIVWGGAGAQCALGDISTDAENSELEADPPVVRYKLEPAFLSGGGGNELVTVDNLDAVIDDFVWLEVAWTADVVDDLLQQGGTMGTITVSTGADVPDDTVPTEDATSGTAHIVLGGWVTDGGDPALPVWVKQGCGSIQIYFCPGQGFFFGRNNEVGA